MAQFQEENLRLTQSVVERTLNCKKLGRDVPKVLFCDNGSEFTIQAIQQSLRPRHRRFAKAKAPQETPAI